MSHSANLEAVACFEQALVALQRLPECHNTMEQAIDLRFELRNALIALGEYGRILDELREVETLAEALADQHRLGLVLSYLATHFNIMGEYDRAIVSGQRTLALAITPEDLALRVGAHQHLGLAYLSLGDYRQALTFLRRNVTCLEGDLLYERFGRLALPSVASRVWLLWCLTELGEFAEAIAPGAEGIRIAEAIDHPVSLINTYSGVGYMYLRKGALDKAFPLLERSLALCQVTNILHVFAEAAAPLGYAYALSGRVAEALPLLEQAVEHSTARNALYRWALLVVWLSEAYLRADRLHDALLMAQRALDHARARKERGHQAYALRLLGDIAVHPDPPDVKQAEIHYQQALILANELGMRPLQAHCHRLWSAIIPSACLWTRSFLAATISEDRTPAIEGSFGYGPMHTPAPSSLVPNIYIADTAGGWRAFPAALSTLTCGPRSRKPLSAETACPLPGTPYHTSTCHRRHPPRPGVARTLV